MVTSWSEFANRDGFFDQEVIEGPDPKIKQPQWAQDATALISRLMSGKMDFPTMQVPGMSDAEQMSMSTLMGILRGESFVDPRTSPMYEGLRAESRAATEEGVSAMQRRAQLAGRPGSAYKAAGRFRQDMSRQLSTQLGGLYEIERGRDNPYTRLEAGMRYGGLPRQIEGQKAGAEYTKKMQDVTGPYQYQAPLAQFQAGNMPYYQQQFMQQPSGFSQLMEMFTSLLGLGQSGANLFRTMNPVSTGGGKSGGFSGGVGWGPLGPEANLGYG